MKKVIELVNVARNAGMTSWRDITLEMVHDSNHHIRMNQDIHMTQDGHNHFLTGNLYSTNDIDNLEYLYKEFSKSLKHIQNNILKLDIDLVLAISKYGDNHVDIIIESGKVYGVYHSSNNSFAVTETYKLEDVGGLHTLINYEETYNGLCIVEN